MATVIEITSKEDLQAGDYANLAYVEYGTGERRPFSGIVYLSEYERLFVGDCPLLDDSYEFISATRELHFPLTPQSIIRANRDGEPVVAVRLKWNDAWVTVNTSGFYGTNVVTADLELVEILHDAGAGQ